MKLNNKLKILVLAGTSEARSVIASLVVDGRFDITASLAGATPNPASLSVPTLTGGFGGAEGLAAWCRDHAIDLIVDVTHPFARHISRNARLAAAATGVRLLRFERPPWHPVPGDDWRSFDNWQDMADAIPAGSRVFLAGGTQSIEIFTKRDDIILLARALNVESRVGPSNVTFINALSATSVEAERALFTEAGITLLCCKNSGGDASFAKIAAARQLGLPVWLLARHTDAADGQSQLNETADAEIHDSVEGIIAAACSHAADQDFG
ncbi:MAG: precorrin-6A/cobalt-precorrin-6A reductase [Rhodobiaceae bacterium]